MKVTDPGHVYQITVYDGPFPDVEYSGHLRFMKREGSIYPGNVGSHEGTNCQEVLRALIDRAQYLYQQIECEETASIIVLLRAALVQFEMRAARRHGRKLRTGRVDIENEPTCRKCGHIECAGH